MHKIMEENEFFNHGFRRVRWRSILLKKQSDACNVKIRNANRRVQLGRRSMKRSICCWMERLKKQEKCYFGIIHFLLFVPWCVHTKNSVKAIVFWLRRAAPFTGAALNIISPIIIWIGFMKNQQSIDPKRLPSLDPVLRELPWLLYWQLGDMTLRFLRRRIKSEAFWGLGFRRSGCRRIS